MMTWTEAEGGPGEMSEDDIFGGCPATSGIEHVDAGQHRPPFARTEDIRLARSHGWDHDCPLHVAITSIRNAALAMERSYVAGGRVEEAMKTTVRELRESANRLEADRARG